MKLVQEEIMPQIIGGCDYGRPLRVLIRRCIDDQVLVLRTGHQTWVGAGKPWEWEPGRLFILQKGLNHSYKRCQLEALPRYGPGLMAHPEVRGFVTEHFGSEAADQWVPRMTLVL